MSRSRRKVLVRCAVATIAAVVMIAATSLPASADGDGFFDNFPGDTTSTLAVWNQTSQSYVPVQSVTTPHNIRDSFDTAWTGLSGTLCDQLEAGIKAGDGGWHGRNSCAQVPASQAELRSKTIGLNELALRYFIPGHDGIEYSFNHQSCFIGCFDTNIDVSYDLTLDVVLRFAPGVGTEADSTTPASVESARLSFSNAYFRATVCTDSCHAGELQLDSTVEDVTSLIDLSGTNTSIHSQLPAGPYYGMTATFSPTALDLDFHKDTLPKIAQTKALATVAYTVRVKNLLIPTAQVFGVDTTGHLWQQTSSFGTWAHWSNLATPPGTTIASGAAAIVGADGKPDVFVTGANGHLYEYLVGQWVDRGHPTGTTAVGTPGLTRPAGAGISAVVRGANGHIGLVRATAPTWPWLDLGAPGSGYTPAIVSLYDYTAVVATAFNGALVVREGRAGVWRPWRALGTLPSPAVSGPSLRLAGGGIEAYVTGANQEISGTGFKPFGAASSGTLEPFFPFIPLPLVASAPSVTTAANGTPTIFATDTSGNVEQFSVGVNHKRTYFYAVNSGSILGGGMGAPTPLSSSGVITGFAVAVNGHVAQTTVVGARNGLSDHSAVSRVTYQAHGSLGTRLQIWGAPVQEAQDAQAPTFGGGPLSLRLPLDAFALQSQVGASIMCQAYADGVGWLSEVNDGQVCGSVGHAVDAVRLRLVDAQPGLNVLYRCNAGGWTPWVENATVCGSPGLNQPITDLQVQYTFDPIAATTFRLSVGGWQSWVDDGGVAGTAGIAFEGFEVHSNIGGALKCTPYVSDPLGGVIHDAGWRAQVDDSALCGTVGEGRHIEGYTLQYVGGPPGESVSYRAYVSGLGWGPWVSDGAVAGVIGQGRAIQAIQIVSNPYS